MQTPGSACCESCTPMSRRRVASAHSLDSPAHFPLTPPPPTLSSARPAGSLGPLRADREVAMPGYPSVRTLRIGLAAVAGLVGLVAANLLHDAHAQQPAGRSQPDVNTDPAAPFPMPPEMVGVNLLGQSAEEAAAKSAGCLTCHQDARDP